MGGVAVGRGKKPDWLESTFHSSPAQPACPLATAADTCLNTYTSSTHFALKDLPKFPSPVWLLPEGERKTCRTGKGK